MWSISLFERDFTRLVRVARRLDNESSAGRDHGLALCITAQFRRCRRPPRVTALDQDGYSSQAHGAPVASAAADGLNAISARSVLACFGRADKRACRPAAGGR